MGLLSRGDDHWSNRYATEASVKSLTREDRWRSEALRRAKELPVRRVRALRSPVDREEAREGVRGLADAGRAARRSAPPSAGAKTGWYVVDKDVPQGRVTIGLPGIGRYDPDYQAARVMNDMLGGAGFTSRLVSRIGPTRASRTRELAAGRWCLLSRTAANPVPVQGPLGRSRSGRDDRSEPHARFAVTPEELEIVKAADRRLPLSSQPRRRSPARSRRGDHRPLREGPGLFHGVSRSCGGGDRERRLARGEATARSVEGHGRRGRQRERDLDRRSEARREARDTGGRRAAATAVARPDDDAAAGSPVARRGQPEASLPRARPVVATRRPRLRTKPRSADTSGWLSPGGRSCGDGRGCGSRARVFAPRARGTRMWRRRPR